MHEPKQYTNIVYHKTFALLFVANEWEPHLRLRCVRCCVSRMSRRACRTVLPNTQFTVTPAPHCICQGHKLARARLPKCGPLADLLPANWITLVVLAFLASPGSNATKSTEFTSCSYIISTEHNNFPVPPIADNQNHHHHIYLPTCNKDQ